MSARERFEKWALDKRPKMDISKWMNPSSKGTYHSPFAQAQWEAWQAREAECDRLKEALAHARHRNHPHSIACSGCALIESALSGKGEGK